MDFLKKEIKLKVKNIDGFYPTYNKMSASVVYLHEVLKQVVLFDQNGSHRMAGILQSSFGIHDN